MRYPLKIDGFSQQKVEVEHSPAGSPRLLVGGQPAPQGAKRGQFNLRRDDGQTVTAAWKPQLLGMDIPAVEVDGKMYRAVPALPTYQVALSCLPIGLIFIGGALGGAIGAAATVGNLAIFRSNLNEPLKTGAALGLTGVAYPVFLGAAMAVSSLFK